MIESNPFMSHIVLLKLVDLNSQSVINYLLAYDRISVHTFSQIMSSECESIWRLNHVNWPKHETNHRWTTDPSAPDPSAPALDMDSLLTDVLFLNAWSISKIWCELGELSEIFHVWPISLQLGGLNYDKDMTERKWESTMVLIHNEWKCHFSALLTARDHPWWKLMLIS